MNDEGRLLRLLGLGCRGRLVVVGVDQTRAAALDGKLHLAVVAHDASSNSVDKIVPLLRARHITMIGTVSAEDLGRAVGRVTTTVVGVLDPKLAHGIRSAMPEMEKLGE